MTNPDFAELKEKLTSFDKNEIQKQFLIFEKQIGHVRSEYDFTSGAQYQHTKSSAIISELIDIIQSQSEVIKDFYKTAQRIDKFGYGVNIESKGIISNTEEILVNTCANAIEVITETNTRLQKLRDGKNG